MKFGLSEKTLQHLHDCLSLYPEIEEVKVYGSRAMGNYRRGSDIDLAFYAKGNERLAAQLFTALDELPMPYKFDVTDYYRLRHQPLKEHIDRVGRSFYQKHADHQTCSAPRTSLESCIP